MDGGVIQEASWTALERGTRPADVLETVRAAACGIPVAVMTYVNPVLRRGVEAFSTMRPAAGVAGAIVPDLPVDEAEAFEAAAARTGDRRGPARRAGNGRDPVRRDRGGLPRVRVLRGDVRRHRASASDLGRAAREVVGALRPLTDLPLLVGVGIGTPDQAAQACTFADGVIVGSALMAALADGGPRRRSRTSPGRSGRRSRGPEPSRGASAPVSGSGGTVLRSDWPAPSGCGTKADHLAGCSTKGGCMKHGRWVTPIAMLGVLALLGAGVLEEQQFVLRRQWRGGGLHDRRLRAASPSAANDPIQIGTLLSVSGDNAEPRPGQPVRRRARARLPGRDVRPEGRPDRRPQRDTSRTRTTSARPRAGRPARRSSSRTRRSSP